MPANPNSREKTQIESPEVSFAGITGPRIAIPLIICVAGIIFFWSLGEAAYWDRDEPRNAGCAAEMMARGDWIVPTFNDELRQQKPVLLYWLMGVAYWIFGINEFAGRFFSALLAVGTVVATWGITRSFFDRATALLASLMLASSLMFCVAARAATPDSLLIFCATMALWFFARGSGAQRNPFSNRTSYFGIYICLGLAILAKGPVGFVLPMAVMGWFLLQRDWVQNSKAETGLFRRFIEPFHPVRFCRTLLSMRVLSGTAIALLIAAPWFIAVGVATNGEYLQRFFLNENFGRATQVLENHRGGLWFYPLAILVGFFPWSVFWGPVAADLGAQAWTGARNSKTRLDDGSRFAICWIVIQVVAFSLVKTKLPSYVTPCYPALAILTANAMMRVVRSSSQSPRWLWSVANSAMLCTGIGISAGLWFASTKFDAIPVELAVVGLAPVLMGVFCWMQSRTIVESSRFKWAAASAIVAAVFCVGLVGVGAASVGSQNRMALAEFIRQQPKVEVASFGCLESSWIYYSGTRIVELRIDDNEDEAAVEKLQRREFWQPKPRLSPNQFANVNRDGLIVTTAEKWPELKKRLPENWNVIQTADWLFKDSELLLIGARDSLDSNPMWAERVPAKQTSFR